MVQVQAKLSVPRVSNLQKLSLTGVSRTFLLFYNPSQSGKVYLKSLGYYVKCSSMNETVEENVIEFESSYHSVKF